MELKIEIDGKIMETAIKVVDDTMVVSPKIEKYEPTDGQIVTVTTKSDMSYTCFFKGYVNGCIYSYGGLSYSLNRFFDDDLVCCSKQLETIYPATEEEKKKLFDKLKEEGYEWKAETKELVKLKWEPKEGGLYYAPFLFATIFQPHSRFFTSDSGTCLEQKDVGWCFKTPEECERFCEKLNKKIKEVEP